jgi:outer membrane protein TolC
MKTIILKTLLLFVITILISENTFSQDQKTNEFSLKDAQDFAVANSYKTRSASLDVLAASAQKNQYIAIGLPQISGSMNYQYFINIPTQIIPNFMNPALPDMELKFGTKNNLTGTISANQLIFDGSFIFGVEAAKMLVNLSRDQKTKTDIEVKETVAQAYYLVLVAEASRLVVDSTIITIKKTLADTRQYQINGFLENTDVDQMEVMVMNLENKQEMLVRNIEIAYNLLKFQIGIDISEPIKLTSTIEDLLNQAIGANLYEKPFNYQNHIDYQLMSANNKLLRQSLKVDKSKYYPSLVGFFSNQTAAQRDKFNFFNDGKWYNTTLVGIGLSVPIWSSGNRYYKVQQGKLNVMKNDILLKQVQQGLEMEVVNTRSSLKTFINQYQSDSKNIQLSKRIYNKNLIKYSEGVASSLDLNNAYNQYLQSLSGYYTTIFDLLNSYSKLNKAINNY